MIWEQVKNHFEPIIGNLILLSNDNADSGTLYSIVDTDPTENSFVIETDCNLNDPPGRMLRDRYMITQERLVSPPFNLFKIMNDVKSTLSIHYNGRNLNAVCDKSSDQKHEILKFYIQDVDLHNDSNCQKVIFKKDGKYTFDGTRTFDKVDYYLHAEIATRCNDL